MNETLLLIFCVYVVIGMVNAIKAFDDEILMLRDELTIDAVIEFVFYILLWPAQVLFALFMWLMVKQRPEEE